MVRNNEIVITDLVKFGKQVEALGKVLQDPKVTMAQIVGMAALCDMDVRVALVSREPIQEEADAGSEEPEAHTAPQPQDE